MDREAEAYDACVAALKRLYDPDASGLQFLTTNTSPAAVGRVLSSLADRFGTAHQVIHPDSVVISAEWRDRVMEVHFGSLPHDPAVTGS